MNPASETALLVMDMQMGTVGRLTDPAPLLERVRHAIEHARQNEMLVIYVIVGFREGMPEVSPNNKTFSTLTAMTTGAQLEGFMKPHPDLIPKKGEVKVYKRRVSAFTGSDLEVILRAQRIQQLVLCGIATSGVVLSTTREAADKDYRLTILADCCADSDEEVHRVLTTKVFPRQAEVVNLEDWAK